MKSWTQEQSAAIYADNPTILVSAAAGSGKTAVLIERIFSLIKTKKIDITDIVVVTFTRAAASEMKSRLAQKFMDASESNLHIRRQLEKLEIASISTIHGFCRQILKEYFHLVDMDPNSQICDDNKRNTLFTTALDKVFEQAYEKPSKAFNALSSQFDDNELFPMIKDLYEFLMAIPEPWEWLSLHITPLKDFQDIESHIWFKSLCDDLKSQAENLYSLASQLKDFCKQKHALPFVAENICDKDLELSSHILNSLKSYAPSVWSLDQDSKIAPLKGGRKSLSSKEAQWYEQYKKKRDQWRQIYNNLSKNLPRNRQQAIDDIQATYLPLMGISEILISLHSHFSYLKKENNVYDYSDLEHMALSILKNASARQSLQTKFKAIFVDEYQDTNNVQEQILNLLHLSNSLFMVGDIKQSIYRFRLADPSLFLEKYYSFSQEETAPKRCIDLQKNFRSSPEILEVTNIVFSYLMQKNVAEIQYDDRSKLIPSSKETASGKIELLIHNLNNNTATSTISTEEEDLEEASQDEINLKDNEILYIAKKFISLYGTTVNWKNSAYTLSWKDMAILLPKAKNRAQHVASILQDEGIPVYSDADQSYYTLPEVDMVMAFLDVISNLLQDIPLIQVLKSTPFSFSEKDLANIRLEGLKLLSKSAIDIDSSPHFHELFIAVASQGDSALNLRAKRALEKIKEWQEMAFHLSLDRFIWKLLWDSSIYIRYGSLPNGEQRQANLRLLCQQAYNFSTRQGNSLHGFITEQRTLALSEEDSITAKILSPEEDVVRIMTIHKSKGLEFPVVAILDLGARFFATKTNSFMFHKNLGLAIEYRNPHLMVKRRTLGQTSIALKKKSEERAEKIRLLYVAMTRAKHFLFLSGSLDFNKNLTSYVPGTNDSKIRLADNNLGWLCQAIYPYQEAKELRSLLGTSFYLSPEYQQPSIPLSIRIITHSVKSPVDNFFPTKANISELEKVPSSKKSGDLFSFYTPPSQLNIPLKTSVSSLIKKQVFKSDYIKQEQEETLSSKAIPENLVYPLRLSAIAREPTFIHNKNNLPTSAEKGTLIHKVLALFKIEDLLKSGLDNIKNEMISQLNNMILQGLIEQDDLQYINLNWLSRFFKSDIGHKLLKSPKSYRELSFIYKLPSHNTLLQGVIDCCFIWEKEWIIVDFKSDIVHDISLAKKRYSDQLNLYHQALYAITNVPVKRKILFFLREGQIVDI